MKYLCLVYLDNAHWSTCPDQECFDFGKELAESGRLVAAEPLTDLNEALNIAARIPPAKYGSIELRPARELSVAEYHSFSPRHRLAE